MTNFKPKYFLLSIASSLLFSFCFYLSDLYGNTNISGPITSGILFFGIISLVFIFLGIKNNLKKELLPNEIVMVITAFILVIFPAFILLLLGFLAATGFGPPS